MGVARVTLLFFVGIGALAAPAQATFHLNKVNGDARVERR